MSGTILEVDPPKRLVQTWQPSWESGPPSTVTWMLEPIETGTRLTVRHTGFTNPAACADHAKGWERVLAWLGGYTGPAKPAQYFVSKLLPPRPTFMLDMSKDERDVMIAHSNYWRGLLAEGKAVAFGPVGGPTGGYGLGILKAAGRGGVEGDAGRGSGDQVRARVQLRQRAARHAGVLGRNYWVAAGVGCSLGLRR